MTMLGVIAACFRQLNSTKYFARVDIRELCEKTYMDTYKAIDAWPIEHNNDFKDRMEAIKYLREWEEHLQGCSEDLSAAALVFVAGMLKEDLRITIKNEYKLNLLKYLEEPLQKLQDFTDPTTWNFAACEEGHNLMKILYKIIAWDWSKCKQR